MEQNDNGLIQSTILAFAWRTVKTMRNLSEYSQSPDPDLNPGPTKYEAGVLTTLS